MSHEINIADFAAFCRSKGDEAYNFYDTKRCALAQYGRSVLGDNFLCAGVNEVCERGAGRIYTLDDLTRATLLGRNVESRTFAALADRLEALIAEPVS